MQELNREQLLAKAQALETALHHKHRQNGYQLGKDDLIALDDLIQRSLVDGGPDSLRQFVAIRVAHEVHGKVSYEQLKLLKEVASVFRDEESFKSHRL